jgi:hypothetical protein
MLKLIVNNTTKPAPSADEVEMAITQFERAVKRYMAARYIRSLNKINGLMERSSDTIEIELDFGDAS